MNFESLTNEQLGQNLRELQASSPQAGEVDRLQQLVQELQVHRIELEMQNRALRDTQSELELSIRRYSDLYDHLPLAYVTVTPSGQIVSANQLALEWLAKKSTSIIGAFLGRFLDAYDAGRFAAHLEGCIASGRTATFDATMRLADASSRAVQFSSRRAPGDGDPQIHIAIADVSKLKRAQRTLEDINREQEAFNTSISHDLRAPLVTIDNYAGIVLEEHAAGLDEEGRTMLTRIQAAAQRMETTLKHLLDYSALAREEIVMGPVHLEHLVTELLLEHRSLIDRTKAEILVDRPLPSVKAARMILRQVFANLLTNALKYTAPGEAPCVRIFAEAVDSTESRVVLKVVDQGIGIDPRHHEQIFRVFERLHGYSRYPGSGVGLAFVRRAVDRMEGRVWVESEAGKGSCFCVELPKA